MLNIFVIFFISCFFTQIFCTNKQTHTEAYLKEPSHNCCEALSDVYVSEKGNDSVPVCGAETLPCKTIEKGMKMFEEGIGGRTLKIVDSVEIPCGFRFTKDFTLTITAASNKDAKRMPSLNLNDIFEKGKNYMTNEKILKFEHVCFKLIQFKEKKQQSKVEDETSSIILSKGVDGDLTISDCSIDFGKWTDTDAPFSILRVTEGKLLIDGLRWKLGDTNYHSDKAFLYVSEGVLLQKLKDFDLNKVKLSKQCALELPSAFILEGCCLNSIERITAGPALLEVKSKAEEKISATISKCTFSSVQSLESEKGACIFFEILHPDSELNVLDTTFDDGKAYCGGGITILAMNGKVKFENVVFEGCQATNKGGGLFVLDLGQSAEFECINVSFVECRAREGGGVVIALAEKEKPADKTLFWNCFFDNNLASEGGDDATIRCKGVSDMCKSPFDAASISTSGRNRVKVIKKDGSVTFHDDWLAYNSLIINVNGASGIDVADCGKEGKISCKTIKMAVENCLEDRSFTVYTTDDCNQYDTEPIIVEKKRITITSRDEEYMISLKTVLDEAKIQLGEGMFNTKNGGRTELYCANVFVDTTRASGINNGFAVVDGAGSELDIFQTSISSTDSDKVLNCALIYCKGGTINLENINITHFTSSCASILAEDSEIVYIFMFSIDSISTTSKIQSVITILKIHHSATIKNGDFSNCMSIEHKMGGCLYAEIGNSDSDLTLSSISFTNCSCKEGKLSSRQNEESKGGAIYVRASDDVIDPIKLSFECLTFSSCSADKGEFAFLSLPSGIEQLKEELFEFEMEDIYGKGNLMLLEGRKGAGKGIVDLLVDKENRLPYHSHNIFIGGDKANSGKTCGRKEEPCDSISTGLEHATRDELTIGVIGKVSVTKSFRLYQYVTFSSAISCGEQNRGILHIEANINAENTKAVFEIAYCDSSFEHVDIEYPDSIKGDALDVIYANKGLIIIDVIFRPWYAEPKGNDVLGGEGKPLPYKLIVIDNVCGNFTQLVIYGRNGNISEKSQCDSNRNIKTDNQLMMGKQYEKLGEVNEEREENNELCMWDSGLVTLLEASRTTFNDCSFTEISEGAIFTDGCIMDLNNCSFDNNHPVGKDWEKFPSLRHNIRALDKYRSSINIVSLAPGSDGLEGKPFGMLTDGDVEGPAAYEMDSYFFSPSLKNVTMIIEKKVSLKGEKKNVEAEEKEEDKKVEVIAHGSYLFPCGLKFEVWKKREGQEMKWTDCPISENVDETEMKAKVPRALLDGDEYSSVVCRLSYLNGKTKGEMKHTRNVILVKQKKNNPKLTKSQLIIIISSVSAFVATIVVVVIVIVCIMRNKKRRQYQSINDLKS